MIEVFFEKDYNVLVRFAPPLGVDIAEDSEGMLMREGGGIIGMAVWRRTPIAADIYAVGAPDKYGAYYDLLFRSSLNHIISRAEQITVADVHDYYIPLGFAADGGKMKAMTADIKFPHYCK